MRPCRGRDEDGQISLLLLGLATIAILLVLGAVVVTSVQLARVRLYAVADGLALDAADALDDAAYARGLGDAVPVASAGVVTSASAGLAATALPPGLAGWSLRPGTGSPDAESAVVVLRGEVRLPFVGGVLRDLGGSVAVTVTSRARAGLVP